MLWLGNTHSAIICDYIRNIIIYVFMDTNKNFIKINILIFNSYLISFSISLPAPKLSYSTSQFPHLNFYFSSFPSPKCQQTFLLFLFDSLFLSPMISYHRFQIRTLFQNYLCSYIFFQTINANWFGPIRDLSIFSSIGCWLDWGQLTALLFSILRSLFGWSYLWTKILSSSTRFLYSPVATQGQLLFLSFILNLISHL